MPIRYSARFAKQYARLPDFLKRKVNRAVGLLDLDFRHPGLRSHPVAAIDGVFEAYVDAKYRMTFEHRGDLFILRNVDNHDECLRNP